MDLLSKLRGKKDELQKILKEKIRKAGEVDSGLQSWSSGGFRNDLENERESLERQLSTVENQIKEIESLPTTLLHSNVVIGSLATLEFEGGVTKTYLLINSPGDPNLGLISTFSPLGKELLGRKIGDRIEVKETKAKVTGITY